VKDQFLFILNDEYALYCDELQWIISRRQGDRDRPVKFTRWGREGISNCLRQLRTEPTGEAKHRLALEIPGKRELRYTPSSVASASVPASVAA
jgi:hypothetical protein